MFTYQQTVSRQWLAATVPGKLIVWQNDGAPEVTELWSALRADGIGGVLLRLVNGDVYSCPAFALIEWSGELSDGAAARVLVRGELTVTLRTAGGALSARGAGMLTWHEQAVDAVLGFSVESADTSAGEGIDLPLESGAAWISSVRSGYPAELDSDSLEQGSLAHDSAHDEQSTSGPVSASATSALASGSMPAPTSDSAAEPVSPSAAPTSAVSAFAESGERDFAKLFDAIRSAEEAAMSDALESESATRENFVPEFVRVAADDSVTDTTIVKAELQRLRTHERGSRSLALDSSAYTFTIAGQQRESLSGVIVLGRSPNASAAIGTDYPRLVTVESHNQDISRNHVQFCVDGDQLVVTDLHSRNGTYVIAPGEGPRRLDAGEPTVVPVGTLIDLGQGVTVLLERD